ncbi:MAG TPA: helix-turn-helix transcriptional regulator [Pseudonocardiaceae bacterium]|jgi:transcriptional regulator with XRE-family HTH domain|nr:helix-turn-helix transcriptional regulator [Pseudonocardiaceae bacterium]
MPAGDNPTSQLRKLRTELRQQRDARGLTQREVAEALDWSPSKLIRIERGPVGISVTDVRALLQHYSVTDRQQVDALVGLARASKKPAWWHQYRDFYKPQFLTFLGLEGSSVRIRQYQGLVVPGLLQHPDYVRALFEPYGYDEDRIARGLDVRTTRQELLDTGGPELFFLLDESVLHRIVGSPDVMRTQLGRLVELAALPDVSIRVVPFSVGVHRGMKGSFAIFELSDDQDDYALQLEQPYEDRLIQDTSEETREYVNIFHDLERVALSPARSTALVEQVMASMGGAAH